MDQNDAARVSTAYLRFAEDEVRDKSPLYGELLRGVASDPEMFAPTRPVLARGVVRYVGNPVAYVAYDTESGQFLAGSFMDYAMPRAEDLPPVEVSFNPVRTPSNELGVKGIGEAGACVAPPSIVSAACDALGVAHLDMPLLPEKIWPALQQTRLRAAAD